MCLLNMEKKVFGVILTIAGAISLIVSGWYVINTSATGVRDIKLIAVYGILGIIFFYAGIKLIRTTKDQS
jgi:uncharacterized membrane protein